MSSPNIIKKLDWQILYASFLISDVDEHLLFFSKWDRAYFASKFRSYNHL